MTDAAAIRPDLQKLSAVVRLISYTIEEVRDLKLGLVEYCLELALASAEEELELVASDVEASLTAMPSTPKLRQAYGL